MSHCTSAPPPLPPASSEQGLMRTGALTKPLPGTQNTRLSEKRQKPAYLYGNSLILEHYVLYIWPIGPDIYLLNCYSHAGPMMRLVLIRPMRDRVLCRPS